MTLDDILKSHFNYSKNYMFQSKLEQLKEFNEKKFFKNLLYAYLSF